MSDQQWVCHGLNKLEMLAKGWSSVSFLLLEKRGIHGRLLTIFQERLLRAQAVEGVLSIEAVLKEKCAFAFADVNRISIWVHSYSKRTVLETNVAHTLSAKR